MINFKKILKVSSIILAIILVLSILSYSGLKTLVRFLALDYMNCDEFTAYYEENKNDFDYVAKELYRLCNYMAEDDKTYGTIKKPSVFKIMIDRGRLCDYIGKGLVIYPNICSNIDYRLDEIKKADTKILKNIFKNKNIIYIRIYKNHIKFCNRTGLHFSNHIIYSQDPPPFNDASWAVNYKYIPIAENWYYVAED